MKLHPTGSVPLPAATRAALFARVRAGAGLVAVHRAWDTWADVPQYGELLGGTLDGHPWRERVRAVVFYTALGHRPAVWADPRVRTHLLAGIRWVLDG